MATTSVTCTTAELKPWMLEASLANKLLYGSSAAVLVLIIVLIVRECAHRKKSASKSKIESKENPMSPERQSDIESDGQQDRVQSYISDDANSFLPDPPDPEEPPSSFVCQPPAQSQNNAHAIVSPSRTNPLAPLAKNDKNQGKSMGRLRQSIAQKIVTKKPVPVAPKNKTKNIATEEEFCDTYLVANRNLNTAIIEVELDDEGSTSENTAIKGAKSDNEGRQSDIYINAPQRRGEVKDEELYANACTLPNSRTAVVPKEKQSYRFGKARPR